MMKKLYFLFCVILASLSCYADGEGFRINLTVGYVNPSVHHGPRPTAPMQAPVVYLENYTLSFNAFEEGCAIQLLDENDVDVFSSMIPAGTTSFLLPTTLEGEYQIQLIYGNFIFTGYIEL